MIPAEPRGVTFPMSRLGRRGYVHAVRMLSTAQVTVGPGRPAEEARLRRDEIMEEAQQNADVILEHAHAKAREAAVAALRAAPPPQSDRERQAAQAELAYLRTYSDVYEAHLRAYTEGIVREIEEWERAEAPPAVPIAVIPELGGSAYPHY